MVPPGAACGSVGDRAEARRPVAGPPRDLAAPQVFGAGRPAPMPRASVRRQHAIAHRRRRRGGGRAGWCRHGPRGGVAGTVRGRSSGGVAVAAAAGSSAANRRPTEKPSSCERAREATTHGGRERQQDEEEQRCDVVERIGLRRRARAPRCPPRRPARHRRSRRASRHRRPPPYRRRPSRRRPATRRLADLPGQDELATAGQQPRWRPSACGGPAATAGAQPSRPARSNARRPRRSARRTAGGDRAGARRGAVRPAGPPHAGAEPQTRRWRPAAPGGSHDGAPHAAVGAGRGSDARGARDRARLGGGRAGAPAERPPPALTGADAPRGGRLDAAAIGTAARAARAPPLRRRPAWRPARSRTSPSPAGARPPEHARGRQDGDGGPGHAAAARRVPGARGRAGRAGDRRRRDGRNGDRRHRDGGGGRRGTGSGTGNWARAGAATMIASTAPMPSPGARKFLLKGGYH